MPERLYKVKREGSFQEHRIVQAQSLGQAKELVSRGSGHIVLRTRPTFTRGTAEVVPDD